MLGRVRVVLVRPQQHGNVGVAARAVAKHGLGGLTLVAPPAFDPERCRWRAAGGEAVIDAARFAATVGEAVAESELVVGTSARSRRIRWQVWSPADLARAVVEEGRLQVPTAILFGPEDFGLSNDDLARCDAVVALPTEGGSSLNLGQAVAVVCSALLQSARGAAFAGTPPAPRRAAPAGLLDLAVDDAMEILARTGYLSTRSPVEARATLTRLLRRAAPGPEEAGALRGMLKKVKWGVGIRWSR